MLGLLEFIEAPRFTQLLPDYLSDDDYGDLQMHLAKNPEADLTPKEKRLLKSAIDEETRQRARRRALRRK
jgi:hypothetical protein